MTDMLCGYLERDETIVAFLYDDLDPGQRRLFDAHLLTCAVCREEIAVLGGVRAQLSRWAPPAPDFVTAVAAPSDPKSARRRPTNARRSELVEGPNPQWWRVIPAWAQVAAALLFLGAAAGIAQLDVRYDRNGLIVRTGWSRTGDAAPGPAARQSTSPDGRASERSALGAATDTAPWRQDLAALEQQIKTEFHASQTSGAPGGLPMRPAASADAETIRRVRALIDESEKRQQRELALRVAELVRDVNRQRQADLVKIDRNMDLMQNRLGVEVLQQRQSLNYFMRVNQRQ